MKVGAFLLVAASVIGAALPRPPSQTPTYQRDIAPLLAAKCTGCHSAGGAGPFKLSSYLDVRKRADLVSTVSMLHKMPPTEGASDFGSLTIYPALTDGDVIQIQEWIRTGMAEGAGPLPTIKETPKWRLGQPNMILGPEDPVVVPPEGNEVFKEVVLTVPLDAERDLVAFDVRPSSPASARRVLLAREKDGERLPFAPTGIRPDRLVGAWAVGYRPWKLPEDAGITLKPGEKLRVRLTYHPTGKLEDGGFELGLYFSDTPRKHEPVWKTIGADRFELPGGEPYTTDLTASVRLESGVRVVSVVPEARSLATYTRLIARYQDFGKNLLAIDRWDKRWIGAYNFETPPAFPAGVVLESTTQYRNSSHDDPSLTMDEIKRLPPNPTVRFGPTDKDELFWTHVQLLPNP